jgi:hypothetical protein
MDEDKVLAKLQELKAREEAKAQEQALKEAKQKREAEERAIEQEALRRYEESKVNGYIEANDIEALFDYITFYAEDQRSKRKHYWFRIGINYTDKKDWYWNKQTFVNQYNNMVNSYHYPNYYLLSQETRQRIYDTIIVYFDSKIKEDDDYDLETRRLKQIKIDYDKEQMQIKYDEQMKEDFNYFMKLKGSVMLYHSVESCIPQINRRLKLEIESQDSKFETLFWNHIKSIDCFDKCPSCSNKPNVIKRCEYQKMDGKHTVVVQGLFTIINKHCNNEAMSYSREFGTIKYITCCEHLFNLDDNKRYIQADKVKVIASPIVKLAISGRTDSGKLTEKDYVLYDPEDPYKIKAKREKDIADTTQEIETLRASLQDAIERLNMLRSDSL